MEGFTGQGGAPIVFLICQGCGNMFTERGERPPVSLHLFRPIRARPRRRSAVREER